MSACPYPYGGGADRDAWLQAFHADSLTLAAAAVLASRSTLREAAHRLHDAGFALPPGYEMRVNQRTGHDSYSSDPRETPHDDLVLATALAYWSMSQRFGRRTLQLVR